MIHRLLTAEIAQSAQEYPVITLIGPRQAGKTTLCRQAFPQHTYVNLENPEIRQLAAKDPRTFLTKYPGPAIFDEVQRVPELLSWIQVLVDERPKDKGRFILTGSHQLKLRESISQSLAGRTAVLTLLPYSLEELRSYGDLPDRAELMLRGFLPRIHEEKIRPQRAYRDYYQTYVERDVRALISLEKQQEFEQFLKLLAGRVGQELNLHSLGNQLGVSSPQLKKWLSVLEASFLVFRLPPWFQNVGKRLTKTPKIYFTEVGLACYLLGIESTQQLERDPLFGSLFENMVVADALKQRLHAGKDANLYFYRDQGQHEIDLLVPSPQGHVPIEIKSSRTFQPQFAQGIHYYQTLTGMESGVVVCDSSLEFRSDSYQVCNFRNFHL